MIFSIVHNKISLLIFVVSIANSEGDYTTPSFEALTGKAADTRGFFRDELGLPPLTE